MDVSYEDVVLRNQAGSLAATNQDAALAVARAITNPWYACQALASVAERTPDDRFAKVIDEAFNVARKAEDFYHAVAATAWPVGTIVSRGNTEMLSQYLPQLCNDLDRVEPRASRSEAAFLLFQSLCPAGEVWWKPMFERVLEASLPSEHWRQRRNVRDAIIMITSMDPVFAQKVLAELSEDKLRRRITARLNRFGPQSPRKF